MSSGLVINDKSPPESEGDFAGPDPAHEGSHPDGEGFMNVVVSVG